MLWKAKDQAQTRAKDRTRTNDENDRSTMNESLCKPASRFAVELAKIVNYLGAAVELVWKANMAAASHWIPHP